MTRRAVRLWRMPLVLGSVTAVGLASALLADGWADAVSWGALSVPLAVLAWYTFPRRATHRRGAR
jgi:hypothetical protein